MTPAATDPILAAERLTYRYGQATAVDGVTFELVPGVTALLGPNGAGKSTLMRMLATGSKASVGLIRHHGLTVTDKNVRAYRSRLGYLPQKPSWHGWMTVEETVCYFAWMRGVPRAKRPAAVEQAVESVGLTSRRRQRLASLSGGMVQRALLAQAVVHRPEVLILDEPSVGLDPEQRFELRRIIRGIHPGGAVLISTHVLEDVAPLADRMMIINHGRLRFDGLLSDVTDAAQAERRSEHSSSLESAYLRIVSEEGSRGA